MNLVWVLAQNVWLEQVRNRFYHLIWVFGGVLVYASLLVGVLAVEQELRVLVDLGLAMLELLSVAAAVFVAANSILREVEQKTIYLILTRPVPRGVYLLGRFAGLQLSVFSAALAMAALHLSLLGLRGWAGDAAYAFALAGILAKVLLISAVTVLLAMLSTSVFSALTMTGIVWVLGHFTAEIDGLARKTTGFARLALRAVDPLLPNLQAFNLRDSWPPEGNLVWGALGYGLLYLALYSGACLALSYWMFRKREF